VNHINTVRVGVAAQSYQILYRRNGFGRELNGLVECFPDARDPDSGKGFSRIEIGGGHHLHPLGVDKVGVGLAWLFGERRADAVIQRVGGHSAMFGQHRRQQVQVRRGQVQREVSMTLRCRSISQAVKIYFVESVRNGCRVAGVEFEGKAHGVVRVNGPPNVPPFSCGRSSKRCGYRLR
jgi:hypothetical protein